MDRKIKMDSGGSLEGYSVTGDMGWSALERLSNDVFKKLVDAAFKIFTEDGKGELLSLKTEEISISEKFNTDSTREMLKAIIYVATEGVKQNHTPAQFQIVLKGYGFSDEKVTYLSKKWELHHSTASKHIAQMLTINRLVDMEWKFGVTAASSESNRIGHTFLQLKLVVNKGDKLENVYMELTLPQFYAFLHEMERAKMNMEHFH